MMHSVIEVQEPDFNPPQLLLSTPQGLEEFQKQNELVVANWCRKSFEQMDSSIVSFFPVQLEKIIVNHLTEHIEVAVCETIWKV